MEAFIADLYEKILTHQDSILNTALKVVVILVLALIVWWIFNKITKMLEKKYLERPFFQKNQDVFVLFKKAGHYTIVILLGIGLINLAHLSYVEKAFFVLMILLLASFTNAFIGNLLPRLHQSVVVKTKNKIDNVIFDLLKKFASVIIFITAGILALDVLGVNIMPFIAGAGVIGIAIGFAAKDTLSNVLAGILLIIDRPFEVGDRIEVWSAPANSATWGDVVTVGLRATKIRTTDNIVIVIPNNEIMLRDIINYTTGSKEIRVRIPIGIAYDADIKKAKEIIEKVSFELEWVMRDPPPKIVVRSFGDSAVNLEARVWISEPRKRIDTIDHVTDRVKQVFHEEGIEIPYPKRDIYIKGQMTS
jgi:small-conductance mechanosensitive channel